MDYQECLSAIRRRYWLILAAVVFAVLSAWAASRYLMQNEYESNATIIVSGAGTNPSRDMLLDPNTIMVYYNLAESDSVAEGIINRLHMGQAAEKLRRQIGVEADYDTGIMKISVKAGTAELSRSIAEAFIGSLQEQAAKLSLSAQIKTIDAPKLPTVPSSPDTPLNMALGAVGGLFLGLLLALYVGAAEQFADEIPALRRFPRLRLLGALPREKAEKGSYAPVVFGQSDSPPCEAMKLVSANLQFLLERNCARRLMVTSPRPGEGKTTLAVNIAVAMARLQKRVLLVECNARRPALNRICSMKACKLVDAPPESQAVECRSYRAASLGIDIVPEIISPCNQTYSLGSPRMRAALDELSANYDLVVLDCPSVLPWADALLLSRLADGVVIVADYRKMVFAALERCLRRMTQIGANIFGVVLNNMPANKAFHRF